MAQRTLVLRVTREEGDALEAALERADYSFHSAPHARFQAKGPGVSATLYRSGKLVVQGRDPETFAAVHLDRVVEVPEPPAATAADGPVVGSDESGKGDYFGPLVVVAVRLDPGELTALAHAGVRDSKQMSDEHVLRVGAALRGRLPHAVERLDPPAYNAEYARVKNLNPILAALHARAIRRVAEPGDRVVVDQFAGERLMRAALEGLDGTLEQRPRAEEIPAVAAASVIAREEFLVALSELSDELGVDLHKGAGPPVDRAGARLLAVHGPEGLARAAKLHFKNTAKIGPRR